MTAEEKFNLDAQENKQLLKFFSRPPRKPFKRLLSSPWAPLLLIPLGALYFFIMFLIA